MSSQSPQLPPPPGWYPDLGGSGSQRWWDGSQWTEHVHAAGAPASGMAAFAPPGPAGGAPGGVATPVKPRYQQKWWHLPLVIGLAVTWTVVWIVLQFVT